MHLTRGFKLCEGGRHADGAADGGGGPTGIVVAVGSREARGTVGSRRQSEPAARSKRGAAARGRSEESSVEAAGEHRSPRWDELPKRELRKDRARSWKYAVPATFSQPDLKRLFSNQCVPTSAEVACYLHYSCSTASSVPPNCKSC